MTADNEQLSVEVSVPFLAQIFSSYYGDSVHETPVEILAEHLQLAIHEMNGFEIKVIDVYKADPGLSPAATLSEERKHMLQLRYHVKHKKLPPCEKISQWSDPIPFIGYRFRGRVDDFISFTSGTDIFDSLCSAVGAPTNDQSHPYLPPWAPLTSTRLPFNIRDPANYINSARSPSDRISPRTVPISQIAKLIYYTIQYPATKQNAVSMSYQVADVAFNNDIRHTTAIIRSTLADFGDTITSLMPVSIVEPKTTSAQFSVPLRALATGPETPTAANVRRSLSTPNYASFITMASGRQFLLPIVPYVWGCDKLMLTLLRSEYARLHARFWNSVLFP
jgi:hypothetical protein